MDIPSLIGIAVAAFVATNIDNIVVLIAFFSAGLSARKVVFGQYIGLSAIVAASIAGSLVSHVVPAWVVGLMGVVPIALGIKKLLERDGGNMEKARQVIEKRKRWGFLGVTAVTIANAGDNIGVYTPIFASTFGEVGIITAVFVVMLALWCGIAYYLVNHSILAERIRKIDHRLLPFVLIGLGIYILASAFVVG